MSDLDSFQAHLVRIELLISKLLGISSSDDSVLGCLRPHLKKSEILGHGAVWLVIVALIFALASDRDTKEKLLNLEIALLLDLLVVGVSKAVIRRPRPPDNFDDQGNILSDKYSMPSGHTSRAVLLYYFVPANFHLSAGWTDVLKMWVIVVVVSRLAMARHYPSDVVVGGVLGYVEACVVDPNAFWMRLESLEKALFAK